MATDAIIRLKAQILAEAGVPYSALEKEIGVARRTIQRWGEAGNWKTPWKINQLFEQHQLQDRLTGWMMGPKGPLRVRLMYDYLVSGAVDPDQAFSLACQDADDQAGAWRDGAVYPILRAPLTEAAIGQSSRMQELGIEPETRAGRRQGGCDGMTQQDLDGVTGVGSLRANIGEIGEDWQENEENPGNGRGNSGEGLENSGNGLENVSGGGGFVSLPSLSYPTEPPNCDRWAHPSGLIVPKFSKNTPTPPSVSRSSTSPLDVLLRATEQVRQVDTPAQKLRQSVTVATDGAGVCGTPIDDFVPTIGEKDRAASILEVLPRDFEGFVQVVRDSESLGRAIQSRSSVFQDNVSATLLKLSQYALQLAETDPRKALIVMTQIAKLAATGQKTFKLDEEKDSNRASDAMRRNAQKEEDGEDAIVLDV